jgi:hypothetical protein
VVAVDPGLVRVPAEQAAALVVGALARFCPFAAGLQAPGVGTWGAEHEGDVALLMPLQLHVQLYGGLVVATGVVELPALHAAAPVGAAPRGVWLFAVPHTPGTICGAEQFAGVVLNCPVHVQL